MGRCLSDVRGEVDAAVGNTRHGGPQMKMDTFVTGKQYEAHDLLRLRTLPAMSDTPPWLSHAFADAPYAVVRRAEAPPGFVAVGFRGPSRAQRYGAFVALDSIAAACSPEHLLDRTRHPERRTLGAFQALDALAQEGWLDALTWGPTGSVGFELATEHPVVSDTSDLDLLVRMPRPLPRASARTLRTRLSTVEAAFGVRIDTQLETPAGGVALDEWADHKPRVMVRSIRGPSLVADPWFMPGPYDEVQR